MRRKFTGIAAAAVLAIAAVGASSASAATEFGDNCVANDTTEASATYFAFTAFGNPLPLTAPTGGVITKWKSTLVPAPVSILQTLKVLRQNGPTTVLVVGESSGTITAGLNTFDARIPIQAGDHLGLFGPSEIGALFCSEEAGPENSLAGYPGGGSVGQTVPFIPLTAKARFSVAAILEPDADGDGFGDETQDQCPQVAAFQTTCPVVTLDASARARKGSVSVLVTATSQAPVTVSGTAKLGKGKTAKLKGSTQVVVPGAIARFTLFFPKKLREKLKDLSTKQSLKLNVTASATDLIGRVSTDSVKVKLKGQKKPPRKKGKGKA